MATNSTTRKTIIIDVQGKSASIMVDGVKKSFKELNTEINQMKKGMDDTNMATGAASATVLELGRAVSDSNYGIRGMANNLSQLATNFIYTTKQAGTLLGGLKNIGQALMGPLGVILLFQGAIAALERWSMTTEKATEVTSDFNDTLAGAQGSAATNLKILRDSLKRNNLSQEQANKAVQAANKQYRDLNLELDSNNQLTDDSVIAIDNRIDALGRLAKASALSKLFEEKYGEMLSLQTKQMELDTDVAEKNIEATKARDKATKNAFQGASIYVAEYATSADVSLGKAQKAQEENLELIKELETEILTLFDVAESEDLISLMFKETTTRKTRPKAGKDDPVAKLIGEDLFERAMQLNVEQRTRFFESISALGDEAAIRASEGNMRLLEEEIAHQELMASELKEGTIERLEAEHEISIMRMDLQDQEFEHEMMLLDLRRQAQLEYVDFVSGLGQVFTTLGKESEALAKVGLVVQKGAAIAGVVIEAQKANAEILSASSTEIGFYKAAAAVNALNPAALAFYEGKALEAKAGAAKRISRNNIGAGIAIANILATTLTSRTAPSGGGRAGGEGGGGRTFDFNLVGTTGTNQLAEAVGAQFQEPIQAYVVSSQITSQQELDLQIETGASLGD